ncbi:MAG: type II toxin-antitoxin system HicB family antitoxin [Dehalococcoidia bacterium]
MKFLVTVERDEDGKCLAECPYLPGLTGEGQSPKAALANIRKAIEASVAKRREDGQDPALGLTGPSDLVEMSDEAIASIKESIEGFVQARRENGLPTYDLQITDVEIAV